VGCVPTGVDRFPFSIFLSHLVKSCFVNLSMPTELAPAALNHSDRARFVIDSWGEHNLFCPNCSSSELKLSSGRAGNFSCSDCQSRFHLKGQHSPIGDSISAGEYDAVTRAMRNGNACGYFFLHYEPGTWIVRDLLLVPLFAVPQTALARRATRCHFLLERIPPEARIAIVTTIRSDSPGGTECIMISRLGDVREKFRRLRPRKPKKG
jgi:Dam-replacing family